MKNENLNASDLKTHNRKSVFRYIYTHGRCTKQDIVYGLGLSLPTVTTALSELSSKELFITDGTASSTGGRKAQYLNINNDYRVFIGISISRDHQRVTAIDFGGNTIAYKIFHNGSDISPEKLSLSLANNFENFLNDYGINEEKIASVYISLPGIISQDNIIKLAPTLDYKNVAFKELTKHMPCECRAVNDADAGGFSEWWNGGTEGTRENLIYLSLSKGIGGSIYLYSKKYLGNNNHSAEFGHMCIVPGGKQCSCGKKGCFEAYCSVSVISDDLGCTIEDFFDKVKGGDPHSLKILDEYLDKLAVGILNINTVFDATIIIGGTLSRFTPIFADSLRKKILDEEIFNDKNDIFTVSRYTDTASCYGAALLGINSVFKNI